MRITIDTTLTPHQIEIDGTCTLGELTEFLSRYYPDFTWRDIVIGGIKHYITLPHSGNPYPLQPPWHVGDYPIGSPPFGTISAGSTTSADIRLPATKSNQ